MRTGYVPVNTKQMLALVAVFVLLPHVGIATATIPLNEQLMQAAWSWNLALVKILLDKGADVNARDKDGATALMGAAWKGNQRLVSPRLCRGDSPRFDRVRQ